MRPWKYIAFWIARVSSPPAVIASAVANGMCVWRTQAASGRARCAPRWIVKAVVSSTPSPARRSPPSPIVSRSLARISDQCGPYGLSRNASGRPGTMRLKWLSMPSLKPYRAAARRAAASSTRATRRPAASGAISVDADTAPSYAVRGAPQRNCRRLAAGIRCAPATLVCLPPEAPSSEHEPVHDAVVIGGGIAGLAAAWDLRNRDIVVLEGSGRLGGRIRSEPRDPYWLNLGAHVFSGPGSATDRLVADVGVESAPVPGHLVALELNGRLLVGGRPELYPLRLPLRPAERVALTRSA